MTRKKFVRVPRRAWVIGTTALIIAGLLAAAAFAWSIRYDIIRTFQRATLPEPMEYKTVEHSTLPTADFAKPVDTTAITKTAPTPAQTTSVLPTEINLAVPFTPQAPHANWDPPYAEFCEEASAFMAASYVNGTDIPNADFADQRLQEIRAFEEKRFGYYEDTTAAETALILKEHFHIANVQVLENPTAADIRTALATGKLVILPAAGRMLGNPYFQTPGPLYHMLVIKGYTKDGSFITNDPGTRHGADYIYSESTVMNAMHDWRPDARIELGRKAVLIVG